MPAFNLQCSILCLTELVMFDLEVTTSVCQAILTSQDWFVLIPMDVEAGCELELLTLHF